MRPKAPTNKMTVLSNILGTVAGTSGMLSGKWLYALCMSQTGPKEPPGKSCPYKWGLPFLGSGLWAEVPGYLLLLTLCTDRSIVCLQVGQHQSQPGPRSLQGEAGERNSEVLWEQLAKPLNLKQGPLVIRGSLVTKACNIMGWVKNRVWAVGWEAD